MVLSSLIFLYLFLPVTLGLYYAAPNLNVRNGILIVASLLFYAWGEPVWICCWGQPGERHQRKAFRRVWMAAIWLLRCASWPRRDQSSRKIGMTACSWARPSRINSSMT